MIFPPWHLRSRISLAVPSSFSHLSLVGKIQEQLLQPANFAWLHWIFSQLPWERSRRLEEKRHCHGLCGTLDLRLWIEGEIWFPVCTFVSWRSYCIHIWFLSVKFGWIWYSFQADGQMVAKMICPCEIRGVLESRLLHDSTFYGRVVIFPEVGQHVHH